MAEYRGDVWQGGMKVVSVQGTVRRRVISDTMHYGAMYGQDGPVIVKFLRKAPGQKWRLMRLPSTEIPKE